MCVTLIHGERYGNKFKSIFDNININLSRHIFYYKNVYTWKQQNGGTFDT